MFTSYRYGLFFHPKQQLGYLLEVSGRQAPSRFGSGLSVPSRPGPRLEVDSAPYEIKYFWTEIH